MDQKYLRHAFDQSPDFTQLATDLRDLLETRITQAATRQKEVDSIINDLRELGHNITLWDEDGEGYSVWGDNFAKTPDKTQNRLILSFYLEPTKPQVTVDFGPWPVDRTKMCQFCGAKMESTSFRVQVDGHGSDNAPPVHVKVWFGDERYQESTVGAQSYQHQVNGLSCRKCGALWFPAHQVRQA